MNNHGGMGPQRGGNDPVLGGHMHQLSSHSPTMGSPESKPVIQASMLAAYQGMILFLCVCAILFALDRRSNDTLFVFDRWTTRQRSLFHRIGPDPVVAIFTGIVDGQVVPELYFLDGRRLGIQAIRSGRSGTPLGHPQEQAQNELREIVAWSALLLRQEHHSQDGRQAIRLPFCLRSSKSFRVRRLIHESHEFFKSI